MSYARKGIDGSSVYVYTDGAVWVCHECPLCGRGSVTCESARDMMLHLLRHTLKGDRVPQAAIERLEAESL